MQLHSFIDYASFLVVFAAAGFLAAVVFVAAGALSAVVLVAAGFLAAGAYQRLFSLQQVF